jgi:transcription-repair coupling factor (superfamily II helicase)
MTDRVWEEASRTLRSGAPFRRLREELGDVVRLPVPAAAWVVGAIAAEMGKPVLAIVPREADALAWLEGAALFAGEGAGAERGEAVFFPAPSLTPYQEAAASLNVRAQEVVALDRILSGRAGTVVTTPRALFRRLPTREAFERSVLEIRPDEDYPLEALAEHLVTWGYRRTDLVAEVGDFAVRGGILDVFPPGGGEATPRPGAQPGAASTVSDGPVRIELFGDTVDTLRRFDPASQRSEERLEALRLLPLVLYPGGPGDARRLANLLASLHGFDAEGRRDPSDGDARRIDPEVPRLLEDLRTGSDVPGWENYLPLLADDTVGLDDFLPSALTVAVDPPSLETEVEHHAVNADNLERSSLAHGPEAKLSLKGRRELSAKEGTRRHLMPVDFTRLHCPS